MHWGLGWGMGWMMVWWWFSWILVIAGNVWVLAKSELQNSTVMTGRHPLETDRAKRNFRRTPEV